MIRLAGETDAGSAGEQPARFFSCIAGGDSTAGATDDRRGGASTLPPNPPRHTAGSGHPEPPMPRKTPACPRQASLLFPKGICPVHAEPVQVKTNQAYLKEAMKTISIPAQF